MKKAEISLTMIVSATMALLVLIVLSFIFFNSSGNFSRAAHNCDGVCVFAANQCGNSSLRTENYPLTIPRRNCASSSTVAILPPTGVNVDAPRNICCLGI